MGKKPSYDQALPEKYILSENRLLGLSLIIKAGLRISLSREKNIGLIIIWGDIDSKVTVK